MQVVLKLIFAIPVLFLFSYVQGQNLVNNPGFEDIQCLTDALHCGDQQYDIKLIADHWWSATQGSPDILSPCNIIIDPVDSTILCWFWGAPNNWLGNSYAHSGQNYAGIGAGLIFFKDSLISDGLKEFPEVSLKEPLKSGKKYCTGLYIKQAFHYNKYNKTLFFYYLIPHIGMYFSNSRLYTPTFGAPPVSPQVTLRSDNNQYIAADTSIWERLYAPYTAKGDEAWLTIGNFTPSDQMIMHLVTNVSQSTIDSSGADSGICKLYIDDVEVIEIPELEAKADTNVLYKGNSVWLYSPTQAEEYTWFAGDTLNPIGNGDSLQVSPTETTTYYLKSLQCKLTTYDTVSVTVLPAPLVPVNIAVLNTLTTHEFTIKYTGDNRPELQAELFNSVGQLVKRFTITETMNIDISNLAAGIYYCSIRKDNVPVLTQKIVKGR